MRWAGEQVPYILSMFSLPSMLRVHRINTATLLRSLWLVASSDGPGEAAATREGGDLVWGPEGYRRGPGMGPKGPIFIISFIKMAIHACK